MTPTEKSDREYYKCGNCTRFYDNECRRFPPRDVLTIVPDGFGTSLKSVTRYPPVGPEHPACAEFKIAAR